MKVIFLGKKPYSLKAIDYLLSKNIEILAVVAPEPDSSIVDSSNLGDYARSKNIKVFSDKDLYEIISDKNNCELEKVDLVISYLFWKKILFPLINLPKIGCINFHPAPLPELRGLGGYNYAIYKEMDYFGASAHFVSESIDMGDIIQVSRFSISNKDETAFSLEQKTQKILFELFKNIIDIALANNKLPRTPQGEGKYISKKDFEEMRMIKSTDSSDEIDKKIRAFWYPPYQGSSIKIDNKDYTLVNTELLREIAQYYHQ